MHYQLVHMNGIGSIRQNSYILEHSTNAAHTVMYTISWNSGVLWRASNEAQAPVVQSDGLGAEVSRFHTPIEAKGRIYLSTTDRLLAFEIGVEPASSAFAAPPCMPPPLIPAHPLVPVHACASCSGAQATIINVGMQKNSPIGDCCRGQQPG